MDEILERLEGLKSFELPFGKFKGFTLEDVYNKNRSYLEWLSNQEGMNGELCGLFLAFMDAE